MSLNVIGLISGGKDSLFSLAHCVQQGHRIVAVANLYPASNGLVGETQSDGERPDLDSFMYQTVGHSIIPFYADALGLPLYRRAITGTAIQNGRYYASSSTAASEDETEDMYHLLRQVLETHPEANALSAGAILSTYQRTRVESVAIRLGLIPLAYLWQYPALPPPSNRFDSLTGLLEDMHTSGCDARIIKIASGGIQAKMGFTDVTDPSVRTKLVHGMGPFFADIGQEFWLRGAVLGEGGEYETLALNGPGSLWKKRIEIECIGTFDGEGGATYVRFGKTSLQERDAKQNSCVPIPSPLDKRFDVVQAEVLTRQAQMILTKAQDQQQLRSPLTASNHLDVRSNFVKSSNTVHIFNLTAPGSTAAEQLETIVATLPFVLQTVCHAHNVPEPYLANSNIISTVLLLRSMEDFASVNEIYSAKLWPQGLPNPPARVTVAASLLREARVSISLTYDIRLNGPKTRKGLHVQSRSYWAPANIGPYSQAISVSMLPSTLADEVHSSRLEVVHLAGQIPLVPWSMSISKSSFVEQAVLALQHLWRVGQERGCDMWAGAGVAFLAGDDSINETRDGGLEILRRARATAEIWTLSHIIDEKGNKSDHGARSDFGGDHDLDASEDESFDVWNLQQMSRAFGSAASQTVGEHLHKLPNREILVHEAGQDIADELKPLMIPPFIAIEVSGLPRNAGIEWWASGIAGLVSMSGFQHGKVFSLPSVRKDSWSLYIVAIHDENSEANGGTDSEADEDQKANPVVKKHGISFFAVLSIDYNSRVDGTSTLPRNLEDLMPHLRRCTDNAKVLRCENVTTQSFINLSSESIETIHSEVQILQDSSIVPCYHVWYQQSTSGGAQQDDAMDAVTEVAVAIVMRIEAFVE